MGTKRVNFGRPSVRVPVLSKATTSTRCANSKACASLIKIPYFAATPVPAMMATGVAKPIAQGQAITSTATARIRATSSGSPANIQPASVASATTKTTGTNTALTWSTSRCIGALAACASSTKRMMWDSTVCAPTAVRRTNTRPSPLMLPPWTRAPGALVTGMDSPVSMDSSACVWPSLMRPSAAKRSPALTTTTSPTSSSDTGTSTSPSGPSQCARAGRKACNARMAEVVWRLARTSNHLPSSTSVITRAEPSKYKCTMAPCGARSQSHTDNAQPAVVPKATNRSILPLPARTACQAAR